MRATLTATLGPVLPEDVAKWLSLEWFLIETAIAYPPAFIKNLANAIKSGQLGDILDLLSPAASIAIRDARDQARANSLSMPQNILALIPDPVDRQFVAETVQYTTIKWVDDRRFFFVWSQFKGNTGAITLMDTIVYVQAPDFQDLADKFLTIHEALGIDAFIQQYLQEKVTPGLAIPSSEREADLYACAILPNGKLGYIGACPI